MKKSVLVGLGALLLVAGTAMAEPSNGFRFNCHFTGSTGKGMGSCRAFANVCNFTADVLHTNIPPITICQDLLFVECGNQDIFNGPAVHRVKIVHTPTRNLSFEVIEGTDGQKDMPSLIYETQPPQNRDPFFITAWLKLDSDRDDHHQDQNQDRGKGKGDNDDMKLAGYCEVHYPVIGLE